MSNRKADIMETARQLFNERGFDDVTTRDIAKQLGISQGNLTYYFPSKNDIMLSMVEGFLHDVETALSTSSIKANNTLELYYYQVKIIFTAHLTYKFLFPRYGEIICSNREVQKNAQDFLKVRFASWQQLNTQLVKEKLAKPALVKDSAAHAYIINMLALYWHQEFTIYFPKLNDKQKVQKALAIFFQSYKPYLTDKGLETLEPLLEKLEHY